MEAQITEKPMRHCKYCHFEYEKAITEHKGGLIVKLCPRCGEVVWLGKARKKR